MLTYHFTAAPDSYDYGCTSTLLPVLPNVDRWRLIAIDHHHSGSFHETQIPRYASGLYVTVDAGSVDAAERGLPTLAELDIDTTGLQARYQLQRAARDALACQSACNLSGVVSALERAVKALWTVAEAEGHGTDWVNRHPICVLFAAQVVHLTTGSALSSHDAYTVAYDVCNALARENLGDVVSRLRKRR